MEKQYLQFKIAEATKEKITIIASDETLDRYGEVVPLDAWDFRNYRKNPVLLVDHDYKVSNIVGRAKGLSVDEKSFTFEPEFHEITQLAKEVKKMVEDGWAPAVSVGFIQHGPKKDGDKGTNELLEISFVAVGANPNAIALQNSLKSLDVDDTAKKQIEDWVSEPEEKQSDSNDSEDYTADSDPEKETLEKNIKSLSDEVAQLKEGRVLSGKNRTLIQEGLSALKQATSALEDLLAATESNDGKGVEAEGRKPAEEQGDRAPKKANDPAVRVLQSINRETNRALRLLK